MWKPPSRLLGDNLTKKEIVPPIREKTDSDYYKVTDYIFQNLEMHPDYEPPMTVTQTSMLDRLRVTYRVNIYTVDPKRVKRLWKSYWVEIKNGEMKFTPEIKNV